MAVTQRHRTVVNPARRFTAKQIAAGFGGKRRQAAAKSSRKAARKNRSGPTRTNKAKPRPAHRRRTVAKAPTRPNLGKILSFSLPKESTVANTKRNRSRKNASSHHRPRKSAKKNPAHRRRTKRNPSMGDLTGLVTSAVFTVAGAVGTKYVTQMVLTTSNTGVMGYFGNLVAAFVLSYGVKMFMKNDRAAAAVLSGGMVQLVLRLINDYTPYGSYVSNLGMGDYTALGNYNSQNFLTPQRLVNGLQSAQLQTYPAGTGMSGCSDLYSMGGGLYA